MELGEGSDPFQIPFALPYSFFWGGGRPIRTWNLRDPYPPPLFEGRRGPGAGPDLPNGASRLFSRARRCERSAQAASDRSLSLGSPDQGHGPSSPDPRTSPPMENPSSDQFLKGPQRNNPFGRPQKQANRTLRANLNEKQAVSAGFTVLLTFV